MSRRRRPGPVGPRRRWGSALVVLAGAALVAAGGAGSAAAAPVVPPSNAGGTVVAWGSDDHGQTDVPSGLTDVVAVSAGRYHSMALTRSGRVVAWGTTLPGPDNGNFGQATVPADLPPARAIAAGGGHSLALIGDNTVIGWGNNLNYQAAGQHFVGKRVTAIAAGGVHSLALLDDGTVQSWGDDFFQQLVPARLTGVRAIAAAYFGSLVLLDDGTVRGYGKDATVPAGLHNVVAIAAGGSYLASSYLAVTADNQVVTWGAAPMAQPPCACGIRSVSLGISHAVLLDNAYTVHAWGDNSSGQVAPLPAALSGARVLSMSAGANHSLALTVGPPAALVAVLGDDQEVPVRQNIEAPVAAVQDSAGAGVPGEPVTFTVSGRAAFADGTHTATVVTDTTGQAESPSLRAANQTGIATITATSGSFAPVTFTVRIVKTPPGPLQ